MCLVSCPPFSHAVAILMLARFAQCSIRRTQRSCGKFMVWQAYFPCSEAQVPAHVFVWHAPTTSRTRWIQICTISCHGSPQQIPSGALTTHRIIRRKLNNVRIQWSYAATSAIQPSTPFRRQKFSFLLRCFQSVGRPSSFPWWSDVPFQNPAGPTFPRQGCNILWLWLCACMSEGSPSCGAGNVRPKHQRMEQNLTKSSINLTQLHPQRRLLRKAMPLAQWMKWRVRHELACPIMRWVPRVAQQKKQISILPRCMWMSECVTQTGKPVAHGPG